MALPLWQEMNYFVVWYPGLDLINASGGGSAFKQTPIYI